MYDYQASAIWNRTWVYLGATLNETRMVETVIPLTCCQLQETYMPKDTNCPVTPTAESAHLKTLCFDEWLSLLNPYLWVRWPVMITLFVLLASPVVLMIVLLVLTHKREKKEQAEEAAAEEEEEEPDPMPPRTNQVAPQSTQRPHRNRHA